MPNISSLSQLVTAISSAVLEAQEKIEAAQVANLMSYFKRKPGHAGFFPVTMKVNLPSQRPGAPAGSTEAYRVPYLSVLPYSALRIKKADVDFDVSFNSLDIDAGGLPDMDIQGSNSTQRSLERAEQLPNLTIDMGAHKKSGSFTAHVQLTLEGVDLPEGAARLINELIKTSQTYESPASSGGAAASSAQAANATYDD